MLKKIDHIGIVVKDIEKAAKAYAGMFGFKVFDQRDGPDMEFKSILMSCGDIKFELIQPLKHGIYHSFLEDKGGGLHHVAFLVDDIMQQIKSLKAQGKKLRNEEPVQLYGERFVFIDPSATENVIIELVEKKARPLEEIGSFFNSRIDSYEQYMLRECNTLYAEVAKLIPTTHGLKLLDLGCGTGLELDEIFKVNSTVQVTGIDLADKMLEKLGQKHASRKSQLNLILANYLKYDFGKNVFDVAVSFESLHHFSHEEKTGIYKRIYAALKPSGFYIEADYMAPTQEFEDYHYAENRRIRDELGIKEGFYHYDTPCTVENQIAILNKADFSSVKKIGQYRNEVILLARK
jgi:tRNA (cmo5U34)-methyltransferase